MEFRSLVELNGKTATGLVVPDDVVEALGGGKRPAVRVTVNGYTYRTTVAPMGGRYLIPLSAEHRTAAGLTAGDDVAVTIERDEGVREVSVPDDLAAAFAADPDAKAFYDGLSFTYRKEWVRWIEESKKPETRATRLTKTIEGLKAGKKTH